MDPKTYKIRSVTRALGGLATCANKLVANTSSWPRGDMHNNYNLRRVECEIGHANGGSRLPRICALCWLLQSVHRALKTAVRL